MAEVNTYRNFSIASGERFPLISNFSFMLEPDINGTLFDVNPMETDLGDMMRAGKMTRVRNTGESDSAPIAHHEANEIFDTPTVNTSTTQALVYGVASVGNGDPAQFSGKNYIQLSTESHSPTTGDLAGLYSYPRVGQTIHFKNNSAWRITGKRDGSAYANAHRLYLEHVGGPVLSATITQVGSTYGGDLFILPGSIWPEGTDGQQTGVVPTTKVYQSYLQTFYDFYEVTDWQFQNQTYPMMFRGKMQKFVYPRGFEQTEIRFGASEIYGLFLTPRATNIPGFDANGNAVTMSTTQGYMPNLETNAPKLYYDSNPTVNLFRQIARLRRKLLQTEKMELQYGSEFGLTAEDIFSNFGVNGGMIYDRKALDLGFREVKTNGMHIFAKEMKMFNHPKFFGAPGFPGPYYFVVAPVDKVSDPKGGVPRHAYEVLYQSLFPGTEGDRDHYRMWMSGGGAPRPTNGTLKRYVHIASRKGMRMVGTSKFILGKPSWMA